METFLTVLGVIGFYMLPAIIAFNCKRKNTLAIGVLNLLLGWTVLGWIIALVWACVKDGE